MDLRADLAYGLKSASDRLTVEVSLFRLAFGILFTDQYHRIKQRNPDLNLLIDQVYFLH